MTERTGSGRAKRRKHHAAASSRVLAGSLAVSATLGLSGMMAAAANNAQVAASAVRPARARITFAAPKHRAATAPPRTATTSPALPPAPPPLTFATKTPAPVAPVANTVPVPVVVPPPATPPRVVAAPPTPPVTTTHAS